MSDPKRPLPRTDDFDTRDFWAATRDKTFKYQQCDNCQTIIFYPRRHCTGCTQGTLQWKTSAGKGTIYTFSVVRQSYHPFFRQQVPYAVAWIDMDEGPRILSNVVGVTDPLTELKIGQAVTVEWEEHEELCIPLFKPV